MINKKYQIIRTDRTPAEERERKSLSARPIYERYSFLQQETSQEEDTSSLTSRLFDGEIMAINPQDSNFPK